MDADAEKMEALKKAYADIILNTARESAAKILASERKALRFQQSLFAAKEEALSTVLRVKSIMDSKIQEAEKSFMGQERKIQELESQLSKAHDTISQLREELKRVNNKMVKRSDLVEPFDEQNANSHATSYNGTGLKNEVGPANAPSFDITSTILSQKTRDTCFSLSENPAQDEFLNDLNPEKGPTNPDLASIIMRSKKHELYRNGCTQRIRAFEHSVLTAKVPSEQSNRQLTVMNDGQDVSEGEKTQMPAYSAETVKLATQEVNESIKFGGGIQEESNSGDGHDIEFIRRFCPRKQRTRYIQIKAINIATYPQQEIWFHEPSKVKGFKIPGQGSSTTESDVTPINVTPTKMPVSEKPPNPNLSLHSGAASVTKCKNAEQKMFSLDKTFSEENSGLSQCSERSVSQQNVMKANLLDSMVAPQMEHGDSIGNLILFGSTEAKDETPSTVNVKNAAETLLKEDDSKLTTSHLNAEENVALSDIRDGVPMKHSYVKDEMTCEPNRPLAQAGKNKFLKYTFQRTRKRGSSNEKNESALPERKIITKRKFGDKQSDAVEPQKSSLVTELPRDNRRLVQVARQLISLSEKRW